MGIGIAPLERDPVRVALQQQLTQAIIRGDLTPGRSVNVAQLAGAFQVSVTPVREAFIELARDGLIDAAPGRGFVVPPLSLREVREIYPLIWTLETHALSAAPPRASQIKELRLLNDQFRDEPDAGRAIQLDRLWHSRLLEGYENSSFRHIVDALKTRGARYEYAYMLDHERVALSADQHHEILEALEGRYLEGAAQALEQNWRIGPRYLEPWLEASTPG